MLSQSRVISILLTATLAACADGVDGSAADAVWPDPEPADARSAAPDARTADAALALDAPDSDAGAGLPVWFELTDPSVSDADEDGKWRPGETLRIEVTMTNVTDQDYLWYPEALIVADNELIATSSSNTLFAIFAGVSERMVFTAIADVSAAPGTLVTFTATAHGLHCEDNMTCPDPAPLTLSATIAAAR